MKKYILVINPGSTSTKLALYENDTEIAKKDIVLDSEELKKIPLMIDQLPLRMKGVDAFLDELKGVTDTIDLVVSRGGSMNGVPTGAVAIDEHVLTVLKYAPRTQHASSIGSFMAYEIAKKYGVPAMFYDSPSSSDAEERIRYTGIPEIKRWMSSHCLNSRMVAREAAEKLGCDFNNFNCIVVHLGGGTTVSFHKNGKLVDTVGDENGAMSPQRSGRIPAHQLISLCFSGKYTRQELQSMIRGKGGLMAYFGSHDFIAFEKRALSGDYPLEADLYWCMAYEVAKSIASLSVVDSGKVDAIVITGGIAYSESFTKMIADRVSYLGKVLIIPGEREMLALARGGLRVLNGEEELKQYTWLPKDCATLEDVKKNYGVGQTSVE